MKIFFNFLEGLGVDTVHTLPHVWEKLSNDPSLTRLCSQNSLRILG